MPLHAGDWVSATCRERGGDDNKNAAQHQFKLAFDALEKAARNGGKTAQQAIGESYLRGWGVRENLTMAVEWLSKSADQGNPWAQLALVDCYGDGRGVKVDIKKAVELLRCAANACVPSAQAKLGNPLVSGEAGTVDRKPGGQNAAKLR